MVDGPPGSIRRRDARATTVRAGLKPRSTTANTHSLLPYGKLPAAYCQLPYRFFRSRALTWMRIGEPANPNDSRSRFTR
jgi:hypothetical protein